MGPLSCMGGTISQGPCPSWSLCAELPLDFLPHLARVRNLQRAGVSCPSWLQAAPGDPSTLACHWSHPIRLCHLPSPTSHPVYWGQDLFQEQKWDQERAKGVCGEQGPPWWCPSWQGLLREQLKRLNHHSQQGSFLFGNTRESPVCPTGSGPPVHGPHGAETQHWLCKSDTFIFFFKSPLPNRSILWRGRAVATALRDSPAELYNPRPSHQPLPALSLPQLALGACPVTPLSPWEQHHARDRQHGCSESPFPLDTSQLDSPTLSQHPLTNNQDE